MRLFRRESHSIVALAAASALILALSEVPAASASCVVAFHSDIGGSCSLDRHRRICPPGFQARPAPGGNGYSCAQQLGRAKNVGRRRAAVTQAAGVLTGANGASDGWTPERAAAYDAYIAYLKSVGLSADPADCNKGCAYTNGY